MVIRKPLGKQKELFFDGFSGRYRNLSHLKHDKNIRSVVVEIWNHNLLMSCKPFRWKTWQFWKYDLETCVTCCDTILTPHLVMHLIAAWGVLLTIANFSMFPAGTKTWHRKGIYRNRMKNTKIHISICKRLFQSITLSTNFLKPHPTFQSPISRGSCVTS